MAEEGLETGDPHPRESPQITRPRTSCLVERILQGSIPGVRVLRSGARDVAGFQGSTCTCPLPMRTKSPPRSLQLPPLSHIFPASPTHCSLSASCQPFNGTGLDSAGKGRPQACLSSQRVGQPGPQRQIRNPKGLLQSSLSWRDRWEAASFCTGAGVTETAPPVFPCILPHPVGPHHGSSQFINNLCPTEQGP